MIAVQANPSSGAAAMVLTHGIEVSGIVVDPSGKPAANVTITRNHEWRNPAAALTTGEDGHFEIANLRPGILFLTFQAQGLAAQTRELTLSNGMPEMKIEMKPGNLLPVRSCRCSVRETADLERAMCARIDWIWARLNTIGTVIRTMTGGLSGIRPRKDLILIILRRPVSDRRANRNWSPMGTIMLLCFGALRMAIKQLLTETSSTRHRKSLSQTSR